MASMLFVSAEHFLKRAYDKHDKARTEEERRKQESLVEMQNQIEIMRDVILQVARHLEEKDKLDEIERRFTNSLRWPR